MGDQSQKKENKIEKEKVGFSQKRWVHIGLIILLTLGVYANSLKNDFLYDDHYLILKNDFIKNWKNLPKIFTEQYFVLAQKASYRPVHTLSLFIDYSLWKLNVSGWRLTNILLHILNAILIYFLISFTFSHSLTSSLPHSLTALITTLLFALHPVQSENINCVSFREDPFSFFFFLLSFLLYLKATQSPNYQITELLNHPVTQSPSHPILYFASCISFILALFSKEMVLSLPLILLLYDFCFSEPNSLFRYYKRYLPYFIIAILYFLITYFLLRPSSGVIMGIDFSQEKRFLFDRTHLLSFLALPRIIIYYLKLLFFPVKLLADYANYLEQPSFFQPKIALSFVFLMIILIAGIKTYKHSKKIFFCIFYFFITLLPVSSIIPFGGLMAERYLYFPSLGFCMLFAITVTKIYNSYPSLRTGVILFSIFSLSLYSVRTIIRNRDWKDEITLWSAMIRDFPGAQRARLTLKTLLTERGISYVEKRQYKEAIDDFKRVLEIAPNEAEGWANLGTVYYEKGEYEQAINSYKTALKINSGFDPIIYKGIGKAYMAKGQYEQAINAFTEVIRFHPDEPETLFLLGLVYLRQNLYKKAEEVFRRALEVDPYNPMIRKHYDQVIQSLQSKEIK